MSSPSNLYLPSSKVVAWALAGAWTCMGAAAAQTSAAPTERIQWLSPVPCAAEFAQPLPGQPTLGLALFRFACPGAPPKLVSARRETLAVSATYSSGLARGERPQSSLIALGAAQWISTPQQVPLDPAKADRLQARRPLRAGEALLERDFEPRRLWIGGELVILALRHGAVTTTVQATALGVGRQGERASVKTLQGKVFSGLANMCAEGPCLEVGP
jgi:flagella basal body P-ring formation protein FlgA